MYEVYLDGKILYYPGDQINAITVAVLALKLNESGEFNITVPPSNPLFNAFYLRVSELAVNKDGQEIWCGEVRNCKGNIRNEKMFYAVGEMSYLNASSQPQKAYKHATPEQMLSYVLAEHNSRVEKRKQFSVGMVTVENQNYDWITNFENTLDYIRSEMCEKLDGYLRIRKVNGVRYLDLVRLQDYGKSCEQPIKFGKNMIDYTSGLDADSIVTVIRPLGAKLENSVIDGVDAYVTIESVNKGMDYIENVDAINSGIGYVWKTVYFNDITDPNDLMEAGRNWLQSNQFENMSINVTAVDLSLLDSNIQSFDLGDSARTVAKPFGMDKWSYITEKKLDLLNPATNHNITIGEHVKKSYTQQVQREQVSLKNQIPQQTAILDLAKENASQIIKNATEGNIYFINDENGTPKELLIMDTPDINTAKKVWRWNINGLGYSSTGYNGTFGLAMTMDGRIVADFITVGILQGITIKGNTIKGGTIDGSEITGGSLKIHGDLFRANIVAYNTNYNSTSQIRADEIDCFQANGGWVGLTPRGLDLGRVSGNNLLDVTGNTYSTTSYFSSNGNIFAAGSLEVSGEKSRVVHTPNYNNRLLYCYEMPSPMFGDIGEGILDETGKCFVFIDDVFGETIDKDCRYQLFLQSYGKGDCHVAERTSSYFVVEGTPGMSFGWEIKAIQKEYDTMRLELSREREIMEDNISEVYSYLETLLYDVNKEEM